MKKSVAKRTVIILCLALFIGGFFVGQFVHIPAFDEYNLVGAMRRPPSNNNRR
jgi:hypothetical protein